MATKDPSKDPSTPSRAYDAMSPRWAVMETLLGGTEAMRAAGETFTPKHTEETEDGYKDRLDSTVLLNMVEQTLDSLCGKPFKEGVKLKDDVPPEIVEKVLPNIDLQGNDLTVFCRQWFREGFAKAFSHVLIDFPRKKPRSDGRPRTKADDNRDRLRPYWVEVKPENLIFAHAEIEDGVEVLKHIRIFECYTEIVGFAEVEKQQIRVMEPGHTQIWRPIEKNGKPTEDWAVHEEWDTDLGYIPLVTFYADRKGFMYGKPPLLDLAYLNVAHWQSSSDQRHILTVARFPILACSGASGEDQDEKVIVGPNRVLYNNDSRGKFYYVEHTGAAIGAGRTDLQDLETNMSKYGAEFLKEKPGSQTATARALDSAEATSDLAAMTINFEDAIAQALDITADWMRIKAGGGSVELVKEYDIEEMDDVGMEALRDARQSRDISRKAFLNSLKIRGVLPEDYDPDEDMKELQAEASVLAKVMFDLDPAQTDDDEEGGEDNEKGQKGQKGEEVGDE